MFSPAYAVFFILYWYSKKWDPRSYPGTMPVKIKQFSLDILKFSTKQENNLFTLNCFMVPHTFLFTFHAGPRRLGSNNFGISSYKEKVIKIFPFLLTMMQISRSSWLSYIKVTLGEFELISNYHVSTTLLQSKQLNQLALTQLVTTVYLSHLPIPTPTHHLSSSRLLKCIINEGCFIFLQQTGKRITKSIFTVVK